MNKQVILSEKPIDCSYNDEYVAELSFMHGDADDQTTILIGIGHDTESLIAFDDYIDYLCMIDDGECRLGEEDCCNEIMNEDRFIQYFGLNDEENYVDCLWPWDNTQVDLGVFCPAMLDKVKYFFYSSDRYIYDVKVQHG